MKDSNKAKSDFLAACDSLGFEPSITTCAQKRKDCRDHMKSTKRSSSKDGLIDVKAAETRLNYCPEMSAEDDDKYEKQLEKAEERLAKAKEKVPDLEEKVSTASSEGQDKLGELEQKRADAANEFSKAQKQAKRDGEDKQSKIMEQVSQMAAQIGQIDEQMGTIELSKTDAAMKRDETKTQIDLNCHQTAAATVGKLQTDALAKMQAGTYSRGGQASLLKNVGMSDRESWQKVAEKYYRWCLVSKPTVESKNSANRMYTQAIAQADNAKSSARKRKDLLQAQMNRLKDPTGACGSTAPAADGSTGESETCRANRQAGEDQQAALKEYQTKDAALVRQTQRAQMAAGQKAMSAQRALAQAKIDQSAEQKRIDNLRDYLDLKANKGSGDKKAGTDFRLGWGRWNSAANAYYNECCQPANSSQKKTCSQTKTDLGNVDPEDPAATPNVVAPTTGASPTGETSGSRNDQIQVRPASSTNTNGGPIPDTTTPGSHR